MKHATVKAARMRPSSQDAASRNPPHTPLMDEGRSDWSPDRISDRQLLELAHRLDRLKRLGDAFAGVELSDHARNRLAGLGNPST